jgi:hypothetical protein
MPFGLPRLNDQPSAATDALEARSSGSESILHRLGVPARDLWYPAAWRAGSDADRIGRWADLAAWVDWLIDAYRLPPTGWMSWWTVPGACEELAALRDWHRELCDVLLIDRAPPERVRDTDELAAWHREKKRDRVERASSLIAWHDAFGRCVARLAGTESKPLLQRETEATSLTRKRRDEQAAHRGQCLKEWLHGTIGGAP